MVSCSTSPKKLEVTTVQRLIERQVYPRPTGVVSPKVKVVVVTPDGDKKPFVVFGYNEKDYLSLAQWLQDVLRFIKGQNAVIKAYENEAINHNNSLKDQG